MAEQHPWPTCEKIPRWIGRYDRSNRSAPERRLRRPAKCWSRTVFNSNITRFRKNPDFGVSVGSPFGSTWAFLYGNRKPLGIFGGFCTENRNWFENFFNFQKFWKKSYTLVLTTYICLQWLEVKLASFIWKKLQNNMLFNSEAGHEARHVSEL